MSTGVLQTDIYYYLRQERMTLQNNTFGATPANTMFWQWATHYLLRAWWLLFVPVGLIFKILHTECHCAFVWLSELTAISLYRVNSLVFITEKKSVYCAVRNGYLNVIWVISFIWISEQTEIISLYTINWLVCITETKCVYCAVRTGYLNIIWVICFIWISEQTAIISLYNINRLVCKT